MTFAVTMASVMMFGVLLLVAYETTILVKLWYWIVNTKFTLLRELKEWKLQMALSSSAASSPAAAEEETPRRDLGLSRRERIAWFVVLIAVCTVVSGHKPRSAATPAPPAPPTPAAAIVECVTLKADGGATSLLQTAGRATLASSSFDFVVGDADNIDSVRWLDNRGRKLPVDVFTENGLRCYTVRLIEPDVPGEWQRTTRITEYRLAATEKNGVWTYMNDYQHGLFRTEHNIAIELPRGAKALAVDPEPVARWTSNGVEHLAFHATTGPGEHFRYKIEYRLPASRRDIRQ